MTRQRASVLMVIVFVVLVFVLYGPRFCSRPAYLRVDMNGTHESVTFGTGSSDLTLGGNHAPDYYTIEVNEGETVGWYDDGKVIIPDLAAACDLNGLAIDFSSMSHGNLEFETPYGTFTFPEVEHGIWDVPDELVKKLFESGRFSEYLTHSDANGYSVTLCPKPYGGDKPYYLIDVTFADPWTADYPARVRVCNGGGAMRQVVSVIYDANGFALEWGDVADKEGSTP